MYFAVGISPIDDTREIKQMGTMVQLTPESVFYPLLRVFQSLRFSKEIEMREDAEDIARHSSGGQDVEKLKGLHLEAVVAIYHQQDDVGNFGNVKHRLELVGTLGEC